MMPDQNEDLRPIVWKLPQALVQKEDVRLIVRELREALGFTQQQLAFELGKAVVTVARWETSRPPKGSALLELGTFAINHGLFAIGKRIFDAASPELNKAVIEGVETWAWGAALSDLLRNREIPRVRKAWERLYPLILQGHNVLLGLAVKDPEFFESSGQNAETVTKNHLQVRELAKKYERGRKK